MKQRFLHGMIIFLFIILIGAMLVGLTISNRIQKIDVHMEEVFDENKNYILVIIDRCNPTYDIEFRKGLFEASQNEQVYTELIELPEENYLDELINQLHMANYLQVDGIILHSIYNEELIAKTKELFDMNTPIVVLNDDLPTSNRISYVGINRYQLGKQAGQVFDKELKEKQLEGDIVIIDGANPSKDVRERLLYGINEVMEHKGELYFTSIDYGTQSVLTAENIANDILLKQKQVAGIFCTDPMSTAGTLQVLLDNNRGNDIVLIGVANGIEMIESVKNVGAVGAMIVFDYYQIAYDAVKAIIEYKETGFVSSYIHPKIEVVTRENVLEVLLQMEEKENED